MLLLMNLTRSFLNLLLLLLSEENVACTRWFSLISIIIFVLRCVPSRYVSIKQPDNCLQQLAFSAISPLEIFIFQILSSSILSLCTSLVLLYSPKFYIFICGHSINNLTNPDRLSKEQKSQGDTMLASNRQALAETYYLWMWFVSPCPPFTLNKTLN